MTQRLPTLEAFDAAFLPESLTDFIKAAWPLVDPAPYVHGWHIDAICEHLQAVSAGEITRLLINVPPRTMKSVSVSVMWPCWEWTTRAATKWLYASYAQSLAFRDSRKRRRLLQSPWFQARWPIILDGEVSVQRIENNAGGYTIATSVGGTATGEGGDRIVIDDPLNADQASSDAERSTANEWFDQTMSTRLNDQKTGAKVIVMQRLHEDDLSGHVLAQGGWTHLCLPARYEPKHPFVWPDDPRIESGEPLWPEHIPSGVLDQLARELGTYAAAGQLQQLPAPLEGGIVKRAWWGRFDVDAFLAAHPHPDDGCLSLDAAFKATSDTDFVVGQAWVRRGPNAYLVDQFRGRLSFTETVEAFKALVARWPWITARLVEEKANGAAVIDVLKAEIPGLIPVNPKESKEARVHAVSPLVEAGNVFVPKDDSRAWAAHFVEEWAVFPNGPHDDVVDAGSQALRRLFGGAPPASSVAPTQPLQRRTAAQRVEHRSLVPTGLRRRMGPT